MHICFSLPLYDLEFFRFVPNILVDWKKKRKTNLLALILLLLFGMAYGTKKRRLLEGKAQRVELSSFSRQKKQPKAKRNAQFNI